MREVCQLLYALPEEWNDAEFCAGTDEAPDGERGSIWCPSQREPPRWESLDSPLPADENDCVVEPWIEQVVSSVELRNRR